MRINKYLAEKGYDTRRGADELIAAGRVFVNGKRATLGQQVEEGDVVEVRAPSGPKRIGSEARTGIAGLVPEHAAGSLSAKGRPYRYYAYNKPKGVVTHSAQEEDDTDILALIKKDPRMKGVFPIGRLDKDSYGLIILTNDGRITDRLLNPERAHDKEYVVRVREKLRPSFKKHMEAGVDIGGYTTKPAKVRILGELSFAIALTEGKKHQIRRMVSAMHNETKDLKRVRIMNITLGGLPSGQYRAIEGAELAEFMEKLGLNATPSSSSGKDQGSGRS